MIKQAVCVIIFKNGEVLLTKRRDIPVWVLPGGGIEKGESPEQSAIREALEETGFKVSIKRKVAEYHPTNKLTHYTHFFECEIIDGVLQTTDETIEASFFSTDQLPQLMPPTYRYWIRDTLQNYPFVLKKAIEGTSFTFLLKSAFRHPFLVIRFLLTRLGIHFNS
ncbi:MAG: NUDIX hydrolase [Rhabdochlamydiaceae bacterium]